MFNPAVNNIEIQRNSSFDFPVQITERRNGQPLAWEENVVSGELFTRGGRRKLTNFEVDDAKASRGVFTFSLTSIQVSALPSEGDYFIKVLLPNGKDYKILEGFFQVTN